MKVVVKPCAVNHLNPTPKKDNSKSCCWVLENYPPTHTLDILSRVPGKDLDVRLMFPFNMTCWWSALRGGYIFQQWLRQWLPSHASQEAQICPYEETVPLYVGLPSGLLRFPSGMEAKFQECVFQETKNGNRRSLKMAQSQQCHFCCCLLVKVVIQFKGKEHRRPPLNMSIKQIVAMLNMPETSPGYQVPSGLCKCTLVQDRGPLSWNLYSILLFCYMHMQCVSPASLKVPSIARFCPIYLSVLDTCHTDWHVVNEWEILLN